ncbi:recombinase family protein [Pedobacter endophyticus]|uniref:Recombinase family protein n=1 Tax=Pedobacter endophyticus TaxID=2789740 RepID=A0A7S9L107_9SPHI|nr:recombinase family protein [Pedobacter endophyticus]QPH40509.1 recombinase family protein [Pedobacter endophyticus]
MKIADLYIRVSTDEQAEKGYSLNLQKHILEKYCELNKINIRQIIIEDFSAKTFNRPEWNKFLAFLKRNKKESDLLLFTRWDRFSRNTSDAYQTIAVLKKLGIEAQAVEQPLNLNVPENKLMLAIYLTMPEIENDRKGLSTQAGLRRAKKEGRWTGPAPLGYINKTTEEGKKYMAIKEPEASIVKWIFYCLENYDFAPENVLHIANKKGLVCSKSNFYCIINNPMYCGKVSVPRYQNEEAYYVIGRHQPLITEEQFDSIQKKLKIKSKSHGIGILEPEQLLMRGFLYCSKCNIKLTASAPGGRKPRTYYYHCTSKCGLRFRANFANEKFIEQIQNVFVDKEVIRLFIKMMIKAHTSQVGPIPEKRKQLLSEIKAVNRKAIKARELMLEKQLEIDEYELIKNSINRKIRHLEFELDEIKAEQISWKNLKAVSKSALQSFSKLSGLFADANIGGKRLLISTIIKPKLISDGKEFHSNQFNEVVQILIYINTLIRKNYTKDCQEPTIIINSSFVSKLKAIGDLLITVPEFNGYAELIKEKRELQNLEPKTNIKKAKIRKKRLARKIIIRKWLMESSEFMEE